MATQKKLSSKRHNTGITRTSGHTVQKRRSATVRRTRTRHRGLSAAPRAPRANTLMTRVEEAAGGAAAAAFLHFIPKPSFAQAIPTALYEGLVCIGGSYVTAKFLKNKNLASGMSGAAGYILGSAAMNGTMMADPNFDLADAEIIDAEDLQALEALEDDNDDNPLFLSEDGEKVMLCEDGTYRYVSDGALYQTAD